MKTYHHWNKLFEITSKAYTINMVATIYTSMGVWNFLPHSRLISYTEVMPVSQDIEDIHALSRQIDKAFDALQKDPTSEEKRLSYEEAKVKLDKQLADRVKRLNWWYLFKR